MTSRGAPPWLRLALPYPDAIPIDLARTLCGGQSFRWRNVCGGKSWLGVASGNVIELRWSEDGRTSLPDHCSELMFRFWHSSSLQRSVTAQSDFLIRYLSLDKDANRCWATWTQRYPQHPLVLRLLQAAGASTGGHGASKVAVPQQMLRVLQQDLHETIFAFLCSQNNHLKRITGLVEKLASHFGDPLVTVCEDPATRELFRAPEVAGAVPGRPRSKKRPRSATSGGSSESTDVVATTRIHTLHAFPSIAQLKKATEEHLRSEGFGYRSSFVVKSVEQIVGDQRPVLLSGRGALNDAAAEGCHSTDGTPCFYLRLMEFARRGDMDGAREELMSLHGVGRKVADCILLFALGGQAVVPIDTHMAQISLECVLRSKKDLQSLRKVGNNASMADGNEAVDVMMDALLALQAKQTLCVKTEKTLGLTPAHHGALQWAYRRVFGEDCGWAHSVLFSSKMLDG